MNVNRRAFLTGAAASVVAAAVPVAKVGYLQAMRNEYVMLNDIAFVDPTHAVDAFCMLVDNLVLRRMSPDEFEAFGLQQYAYAVQGIDIGTGDFSAEWSVPAKTKQLGTQEHAT